MSPPDFDRILPLLRGLHALSVGCVTHDHREGSIRAGGSALYAARAWAALGATAHMATAVGDDFQCAEELAGIETARCIGGRTICFVNQATRAVAGHAPPIHPHALPDTFRTSDLMLLSPVFRELDPGAWLDAVRCPCVALILQGLVRNAAQPDPRLPGGRTVVAVEPVLPDDLAGRLSLIVVSEEDLAGLGGAGRARVLARIRSLAGIVVLTEGAAGSLVFANERSWRVSAVPAHAVDTTGAGDVFAAVMSLALAARVSLLHAAMLGSAAASVVVEGVGTDALARLAGCIGPRLKAVSVCVE